jgi:hypothetical protein
MAAGELASKASGDPAQDSKFDGAEAAAYVWLI